MEAERKQKFKPKRPSQAHKVDWKSKGNPGKNDQILITWNKIKAEKDELWRELNTLFKSTDRCIEELLSIGKIQTDETSSTNLLEKLNEQKTSIIAALKTQQSMVRSLNVDIKSMSSTHRKQREIQENERIV